MKVEDNHYKYRIETKDSNGSIIDFVDIDTVEPLRCAYDVQDELNLETNEHIKRVEEIILNADSTEFWYVDEDRSTDTHLVCYFEEVQLMANADHPMVDTDRSLFEYGKINANEYQDTNFICTHVMPNGVSRIYMSIDKDQLLYQVFTNETIKEYIAQNPITIWYAIRYPVAIPRSMSKGHLLTLDGQTDVSISTNGDCGLPLVKFNIGDKEYNMDNNPIHLSSTAEGTQIRNIVLEGNTPINFARGNGVNTTEATSDTRYDFEPFYDGQATIQGTVEGGYVSAKLYGDTMVNIAKPYGETPLLTATNVSTLCDDLLGTNEEGVKLTDGEITEGRIYGDSLVNLIGTKRDGYDANNNYVYTVGQVVQGVFIFPLNRKIVSGMTYTVYMNIPQKDTGCVVGLLDGNTNNLLIQGEKGANEGLSRVTFVATKDSTATPYLRVIFNINSSATKDSHLSAKIFVFEGDVEFDYNKHGEFFGIGSVVNPTVYNVTKNLLDFNMLKNGTTNKSYIEIPVKVQQGVTYHYVDDYGGWNGSNIFSATLTGIRGDGSTVAINHFINGSGVNRVYQNFTVSTKNNYEKIVLRFPLTTKDEILSKVTKMGIFEGSYYDHEITPHHHTQITTTHTLNKLPNGVADYIDVVNKVHVQRVGRVVLDDTLTYIKQHTNGNYTLFVYNVPNLPTNTSARLDNMICDKLIVENYINLQAKDSEFVTMRNGNSTQLLFCLSNNKASEVLTLQTYLASNPIKVLYQLETPIYTPLTEEEIAQLPLSAYKDGYVMLSSDQLMPSFEFRMRASNRYQVDMLETGYYYLNAPVGSVKLGTANVDVQQMPCIVKVDNVGTGDGGYRLGFDGEVTDTIQITLAKLPSHRIPTTFTQGMRCGTDFGYWEGIKNARPTSFKTVNRSGWINVEESRIEGGMGVVLNRIESDTGKTIVEDELDIATGKLTKRIGKGVFNGSSDENWNIWDRDSVNNTYVFTIKTSNRGKKQYDTLIRCDKIVSKGGWNDEEHIWINEYDNILVHIKKDRIGNLVVDNFKKWLQQNPITIYYELAVPEISYPNILLSQVKTVADTVLQCNILNNDYLIPQIKPSHLTYPVPSLVGNRTYTVVHNRKNITGSTKPIILDLGGTQVELNNANGKTLVKTPSTLKHSSLIFTGGESTVDHVMVLDGDWTNKPIEYFENMKGHDTDAIITIMGDGKIDDVAEQYLW